MPIRECTRHFGGRRTGNRVLDVLASGSACRCFDCGCDTSAGAAMPIRPSKPWLGVTPISACLDSASGRMAMYIPVLPSASGSLPTSSPSGRVSGAASSRRRACWPTAWPSGRSASPAQGRDALVPGVQWPSCQGSLAPERPPAEGWDGVHIPTLAVARKASKAGGRSGHGLRFRRGAAAPEAVMQPQAGQRHTQSPICTSEPRSRAHEVCFTCAVPARPQARVQSPINHQPQLSCAPRPHRPLTTRLNRFRRGVEYPLDGPALAGKPRSREIANVQIVQSIIQKGIE